MVPCPGKEAFASPKQVVIPLFPMRTSAVSARLYLCFRVGLRKQRWENRKGFSRPLLASAPASLPGQQGEGFERPTPLQMIQKLLASRWEK